MRNIGTTATSAVRAMIAGWKGGAFAPLPADCRPPDRPNPRTVGWSSNPASARVSLSIPRGRPIERPDDGPPAGRVELVTAAGVATNYGQPGTRIGRALAKHAPDAARTLAHAEELLRPGSPVAANDNTPRAGIGLETMQGIKPSVMAVLEAFGEGLRPRVLIDKDGTVHRFAGGIRAVDSFVEIGGRLGERFYGLQFFRGSLVAYSDKAGRMKKPWVDATRAMVTKPDDDTATAAHVEDEPNVPARILALCGTALPAVGSRPDAPRGMPAPRTERAKAASKVLDDAFAGDLSNVRWAFYAPGIAADYGLLAGVSEMKGAGEGLTSAPAHEAQSEIDRVASGDDLRARLSVRSVRILEAVASDGSSYRGIGVSEGFAAASAHVSGRRAVNSAVEEIKFAMAA